MGYARDDKRTIAVKSGGTFLAGYRSPEFKPRINGDLGLYMSGMAQSGMAQGKNKLRVCREKLYEDRAVVQALENKDILCS